MWTNAEYELAEIADALNLEKEKERKLNDVVIQPSGSGFEENKQTDFYVGGKLWTKR